jgi:phosphatidylglycerol---prolipoprotein diacylglyceryl transferase
MILQSIIWDVDPWLVQFNDSFGIRWYGLLFACVFLFSYIIFKRFFLTQKLTEEVLDQLTLYIAIGTILGARLGHTFFYDAKYYLENPIEILMIWKGGLASHGGGIGIIIALWLFVRKYKFSFLWLMDRISTVAALGGFFIRLGNLMNSEIYGRRTDLPWGFRFVRDRDPERINFYDPQTGEFIGKHLPCHPTQIYEALSYLLIFFVLFYSIRKYKDKLKNGVIFSWFLILVFGARFLIEYVKFEQSEFELDLISKLNLNMGQLLSLPYILGGIILLFVLNKYGQKE